VLLLESCLGVGPLNRCHRESETLSALSRTQEGREESLSALARLRALSHDALVTKLSLATASL
jgi:hypothetical protein